MPGSKICRLCKGTDFLTNLFEINGDLSLDMKTNICINLNVHPEDGLPCMICENCKEKINEYYNFRQQCLIVDLELRSKMIPMQEFESDIKDIDMEIFYDFDNLRETFVNPENTKLSKPDINMKLNEIITCEEPEIHEQTSVTQETDINYNKSVDSSEEIIGSSSILLCELCGARTRTKAEFKRHLMSHNGIKSFQCKYCPKKFTRAETNVIHMRTHLGIRPFICDVCGQTATKRQDLIRHMKIHSDEKEHACPCCGRCFKRSGDLCSHIRTHSGARPYRCQFCAKDYTSHSGLRKHYKMHCKKEL